MSYDVMLSHATADVALSIAVEEALKSDGLSVWRDGNRLSLGGGRGIEETLAPPGSRLEKRLIDGVDRAAVFVYVDSEFWRASRFCNIEYQRADEQGKRIIRVFTGPGSLDGSRFTAVASVAADRLDDLGAVASTGIEVARSHAALVQAASTRSARPTARACNALLGRPTGISISDAVTLTSANLPGLGVTLGDRGSELVRQTIRGQRLLRIRAAVATTLVAVVAAAFAVAALVARSGAISSRNAAIADAHLQASLAAAADSESTESTADRLADARAAVREQVNSTSVGALRDAIEQSELGETALVAQPTPPVHAAVSDNGRVVALLDRNGAVAIVRLFPATRVTLLSHAHGLGGVAIVPDGSRVMVIRQPDEAAAVIDSTTGREVTVTGTIGLADILVASPREAVGVERDGLVVTFDPMVGQPVAVRVGSTPGGAVRAAALDGVSASGAFRLVTLDDDGRVELQKMPSTKATWSVSLLNASDEVRGGRLPAYSIGQDSMAVCGRNLELLTRVASPGVAAAFTVPFTVSPPDHVVTTGSGIGEAGIVCLPEGTALFVDVINDEVPFPTGAALTGFAADSADHLIYTVASSHDDSWAVAAGSDGSVTVDRLDLASRTFTTANVARVGTDGANLLDEAQDGEVESLTLRGESREILAPEPQGSPARGTFLVPGLGTVMGLGNRVLAVHDGRVVASVTVPLPLLGIRPGATPGSVVGVATGARTIYLISLTTRTWRAVQIPPTIAEAEVYDAIQLPGSDGLALATMDGVIHVVDPGSGEQISQTPTGVAGPTELAAVGDRLLVAGGNGSVRLFTDRLQELRVVHPLPGEALDIEMDASGRFAVVQGDTDAVVLNARSFVVLGRIGPLTGLNSVIFTGDSRTVVAGAAVVLPDSEQASISTWPVCIPCDGSLNSIEQLPSALTSPVSVGPPPAFGPSIVRRTRSDRRAHPRARPS